MARWAGEGDDWMKAHGTEKTSQGKRYSEPARTYETNSGEENGTRPTKKPTDLRPLQLGIPEAGKRERLYLATEQYSSLCVSAVVFTRGGDDIEDGVPDREHIDCEREEVEV